MVRTWAVEIWRAWASGPDSTDRMGAGIDTDMDGDGMDMGGMDGGNMAGMGTGPDSTDTDMVHGR